MHRFVANSVLSQFTIYKNDLLIFIALFDGR